MNFVLATATEQSSRFPSMAYACSASAGLTEREQSPLEWAASNCGWDAAAIRGMDPEELRPSVEAALLAQIGLPWEGIGTETPTRAAMLTMMAAHAAGLDVVHALADMNALALVDDARPGTMSTWRDYVQDDLIEAAMPVLAEAGRAHRFSTGVVAAVVSRAKRSGGVVNARYAWVKPRDTTAWRILDNHGRRRPGISVVGILSHASSEKTTGSPQTRPYLSHVSESVVAAIEACMRTPGPSGRHRILDW